MTGTPGFIGERLMQAREARGLTAVSLAEMIGVRSANISNYERKKQTPSAEVMERIAGVLNQPQAFFLRPIAVASEGVWWRSMSAAAKGARVRALARHSWLREIIAYLSEFVEFPDVNLPDFTPPDDIREIRMEDIEGIALDCRRFWNVGMGPVADIVLLLENNGIIVSRGELAAEKLDAYSQRPTDSAHPLVFIGSDKASAARNRFDAAHELGHLVLHRNVDAERISGSATFRLIEDQAHRFAAAFNLPAEEFANQLWAPTLDAFLALKPHWKVAIGAMIMRCGQLGIVTDEQATRLWINMSRRRWRTREPLDDRIPPEEPRVLRRSFELLINEGIKSPEQIFTDLALNLADIESLACLQAGYLSGSAPEVIAMPQLRSPSRPKGASGSVVHFPPRGG